MSTGFYNQSAPNDNNKSKSNSDSDFDLVLGSTREPVPIVHALGEIYHDVTPQRARYVKLESQFETLYQRKPEFYVRAPGRVNLIGEHIDYMGYSVLPMSIENDTIIAVATSPPDSQGYAPISVAHSRSDLASTTYNDDTSLFSIDLNTSGWLAYVQCGLRGVISDSGLKPVRKSLQLLVTGNVPMAAGLSSSSSLVCATALAAGHAWGLDQILDKRRFADLCCLAEKHIGTMGGGMDQAIAFLGKKDVAKRIDFETPIVATDVRLPAGGTFVVAHTLIDSAKASAASQYNVRVLECQLGALLIAKQLGVDLDKLDVGKGKGKGTRILKVVQEQSKMSCAQLMTTIHEKQWLHPAAYTQKEIQNILSVDLNTIFSATPKLQQVLADPGKTNYYVYQRVMHVYGEAQRVYDFQNVCSKPGAAQLSELGRLMNESHTSCRDLFDCSAPELDRLVDISKNGGAIGARLTGAGWGGCAVALVPDDRVNSFITHVKQTYYHDFKHMQPDDKKLDDIVFASKPSAGAAVYISSDADLHPPPPPLQKSARTASPQQRPRTSSSSSSTAAASSTAATPVRSCCAGKKSPSPSASSTDRYLTYGLVTIAAIGIGVFLYTRYQRSKTA